MRTAPPDVVYFGESTSLFTSPDDADQRSLVQLVDDELGPTTSLHPITGAGYHVRLFEAYSRLLLSGPHRPVVVVPLWVRSSFAAWAQHPSYGYERALASIRQVDPAAALWRIRAVVAQPVPRDWARLNECPHPTLVGDFPVGRYREALRDSAGHGLDDRARLRLLYAFHHGAAIDPDGPYLDDVTRLGRTLRKLGCPVVVYQTPVPVEQGVELLGAAIRELAEANFALLGEAFQRGYGPIDIPCTGTSFATSEFIDPADGSEHINEKGRLRLAEELTAGVAAALRRH